MKNLIKRILPTHMIPLAEETYWRLSNRSSNLAFLDQLFMDVDVLKCVVSYNKHGGYCVPLSSRHRPAARKVLTHDIYEPETIEFMAAHCAHGDIVHAGTYFGDFLPALSKALSPGHKVWAFEPNKENYRCAKITLDINTLENVVLTNAGLGARQEALLLQTTDDDGRSLGGASRIVPKGSGGALGTETVPMVAVDDFVASDRHVSVIQLDVEGHEREALSGALQTIRRCLPIIILEVLSQSTLLDSRWFDANIVDLGYRKVGNIHGNAILSSET